MIKKEKLIELLDEVLPKYRFDAWENSDKIADFILAHWDDADKWVPVSEPPKKEGLYVVMIKGRDTATALWYSKAYDSWWALDNGDYIGPYTVVCWHPLP